MALSAEIQVEKELGVPTRKRKATNFSKLFEMPPHVTYTAREHKTAKRLRRHMNTNVVSLTDWDYMERLERRTVEIHVEDLRERVDERARAAAAAAHLRLWEEVLRGQCTLPLEQLEDPCMQDIRRQQLKLEGLQKKAVELKTTFQRVLAQPKEWSPPTDSWKKIRKRVEKRRRSTSLQRAASQERKSLSTIGQNTLDSLGTYYKKLQDGSYTRVSVSKPAHRRKRAKSVEPESESQQASDSEAPVCTSIRKTARKTQAPQATQAEDTIRLPRSALRIMPEKRKPVIFPDEPPRCLLLSAEGNKRVLGPPTNPDYIIPKYYVPKSLNHLRKCKDLDQLFSVGDELFDTKYPPDDNRNWGNVSSKLSDARDQERMKDMPPSETAD